MRAAPSTLLHESFEAYCKFSQKLQPRHKPTAEKNTVAMKPQAGILVLSLISQALDGLLVHRITSVIHM